MLGQAWAGLLTAVSKQDKPDHSLAIALRQKASLLQDLLSGLETGLQHGFASVRSACFAFWHTPSVQCTLGRHLQGEHISEACKSIAPIVSCVLALKWTLQLFACILGILNWPFAPRPTQGQHLHRKCLRLAGMDIKKLASLGMLDVLQMSEDCERTVCHPPVSPVGNWHSQWRSSVAEVPESMQQALQRAQALGVTPQAESQQQHLNLPPRVLRLQQLRLRRR